MAATMDVPPEFRMSGVDCWEQYIAPRRGTSSGQSPLQLTNGCGGGLSGLVIIPSAAATPYRRTASYRSVRRRARHWDRTSDRRSADDRAGGGCVTSTPGQCPDPDRRAALPTAE